MKIINKKEARDKIKKLHNLFSSGSDAYIDEYLNSKPKRLFFGLGAIDRNSFPALWVNPKFFVRLNRDNLLAVENQTNDDFWLGVIAKKLAISVKKASKSGKIYGIGNWDMNSKINHNLIIIENDLREAIEKYASTDTYFFPEDLSWVFVITHEDLSFVAGSKEFIDKIKENFPDHKKYEPEYWKEILGINNQIK